MLKSGGLAGIVYVMYIIPNNLLLTIQFYNIFLCMKQFNL